MSSFTRGAFAEPRWRSTVILLAAFKVLSSGALSCGYGGSASPIEGGERLDRRQIFQSQRPIRALLPRALVTQRRSYVICSHARDGRRKRLGAYRPWRKMNPARQLVNAAAPITGPLLPRYRWSIRFGPARRCSRGSRSRCRKAGRGPGKLQELKVRPGHEHSKMNGWPHCAPSVPGQRRTKAFPTG